MPSYWNSKTGYSYVSSNYNMDSHTHGGHEREHKEEMERIANDVCS